MECNIWFSPNRLTILYLKENLDTRITLHPGMKAAIHNFNKHFVRKQLDLEIRSRCSSAENMVQAASILWEGNHQSHSNWDTLWHAEPGPKDLCSPIFDRLYGQFPNEACTTQHFLELQHELGNAESNQRSSCLNHHCFAARSKQNPPAASTNMWSLSWRTILLRVRMTRCSLCCALCKWMTWYGRSDLAMQLLADARLSLTKWQ